MTDIGTLYRLADGTQGDPAECKADDKGVMRHKNGMPVAMDSDGKPVEIKREAEVNMTVLAAKLGDDAEAKVKADATVQPTPAPAAPAHPAPAAGAPKPIEPPKA